MPKTFGIVPGLIAGLVLCSANIWSDIITNEMVSVGRPGNPDDSPVFGGLNYEFRMGKFEVTAGQYADFLNAVAATDTYELYNANMDTNVSANACNIVQSGAPGSYTYSVDTNWADRPVNFVHWGDAARFANWLHNGQPTGMQVLATTEDGTYFLNGASNQLQLAAVNRESDGTWRLPSEDEWYKAAYHNNDGITANYWDYPAGSDTAPTNDFIEPDPGNHATYNDGDQTIGPPFFRTEVGEHENSGSPHGTFDQGGNVYEWLEDGGNPSNKVLRGQGWGGGASSMSVHNRSLFDPTTHRSDFGLRVAAPPAVQTNPVSVALVTVANLGYTPDTTTYGSVPYEYRIGTYEVTAEQYTEFLNAVAATDTYGLYASLMLSSAQGCKIQQNGVSGSYFYTVPADYADRPVNHVSWGDAARFANWLHNGQPTGAQTLATTEDGSYFLNGATSDSALSNITRTAGANWVIPSENEWYKAAYHKNDGISSNYWLYPTGTDVAPSNDLTEATSTSNNANLALSGTPIDSNIYYTTVAGEFELSDSPYGTFDQTGNVYEWMEEQIRRGQGWSGGAGNAQSTARFPSPPTLQQSDSGFRVAATPAKQTFSFSMDLTTIGNPGNPNDVTTYGGVSQVYRIGTYEVTAGQYADFLNAVASNDTYNLYSSQMLTSPFGCKIQQNGVPGSHGYTLTSGYEERPVNFVSWGDAARFANWLHNGKPSGAQDLTTTEDGTYFLNGASTSTGLAAVVRESDATWWIASEDQWYKAAYHKNDGITINYWLYPTGSDVAPSNDLTEVTNPGNNANYNLGPLPIDGIYYTTIKGEFELSASPYGTFDQGGNVYEWVEDGGDVTNRIFRGQGWGGSAGGMIATARFPFDPTTERSDLGLRVAAPGPPSIGTSITIK